MFTAKIDEISTFSSLRSQIVKFSRELGSALSRVNSNSLTVLDEIDYSVRHINSKRLVAQESYYTAEQSYQECLVRQRECEDGFEPISCECELRELLYRQGVYETIKHVYDEALQLYYSAKNDFYNLESTIKDMRRRVDSSVSDAVLVIDRMQDRAQDIVDVKAPVYEPSTLSKTMTAAMSNVDSPGLMAKIVGNIITDDPTAGDAAEQLAQMVIDAAPVAAKGFMEAAHRQHAFPAPPLEGVDFLYNENGAPEPIRPMVSTTNEKGENVLIRADATTNCSHFLQSPPELEGSYSIINGKTNSGVLDRSGQQVACIEKYNDNTAILLNFNREEGENLLQAVECIAKQNGVTTISRWVNRKELNFFLNAGFHKREDGASANGCVVEKSFIY